MASEYEGMSTTIRQPAPLVERFITRSSDDQRMTLSLIMGLSGITLFAIGCCTLYGCTAAILGLVSQPEDWTAVVFPTTLSLLGLLCYVSTLLTLHTLASCLLPLSLRLTIIFALIYLCLRLATWPAGTAIEAIHVVMLIPLCLGGFALRRFRNWRALAWNQMPTSIPLTIFGLLDVTAAAALTLMVLTTAISWAEITPESLLSFAPASLMMAVIGIHCWFRLCAICPLSSRAEPAYSLWFTINVLVAFFSFLGFLVVYAESDLAFGAFVVAPLVLVVAHIGTEIPMRWLRGCGWTFERFEPGTRSP